MARRYGWSGTTTRGGVIKVTKVVVFDHSGDELVTHSFSPISMLPGDTLALTHNYIYDKVTNQLVPMANVVP